MILRMLLLALTFGLVACEETPTGRSQLTLVPDTQMAEIGRQAFAEMKQSLPIETDPRTNRYVQCVANAVIQQVSGRQEDWEVVVFQDSQPNAFALPGGKIGVHTGLLNVAETPAQLAAVLGHEVGHVLADHGNERLTQELGVEAVLFVIGLLGEGDWEQQRLLEALGLGAHFGITLPFSRAHEREADLLGLQLMAAAGFDPRQSVELWRNMAAAGGSQPPEFLSTHPSHDTRSDVLQENMGAALETFESVGARVNCSR